MFETVRINVSQDPFLRLKASRNGFSHDVELDFEGVLGARSAHILFFGCPGDQCMHGFLEVS